MLTCGVRVGVADAVDFGLKCSACAFPFPAIELATAWLHLRSVDVLLDMSVADVAENLQIVERIRSALALGYNVVYLKRAVGCTTADCASVIVFVEDGFSSRFVSNLGHLSVPYVLFR